MNPQIRLIGLRQKRSTFSEKRINLMEPIFATPKISKFASVETISAIIQHELQKRFFFLQDSYVEEDIWSSKLVYRQFLLFSRE